MLNNKYITQLVTLYWNTDVSEYGNESFVTFIFLNSDTGVSIKSNNQNNLFGWSALFNIILMCVCVCVKTAAIYCYVLLTLIGIWI